MVPLSSWLWFIHLIKRPLSTMPLIPLEKTSILESVVLFPEEVFAYFIYCFCHVSLCFNLFSSGKICVLIITLKKRENRSFMHIWAA